MSNFGNKFHFWLIRRNCSVIEKLQERALRFVYDNYELSYEELLDKAKMPSLKIRRLRTMAMETFRILHNLSSPCLSNLVKINENSYNFRYSNILQIPAVRTTTYGKNSFMYAAAVPWNNFPENFRQTNNFNHFKSLLSHWKGGGQCKCSLCK